MARTNVIEILIKSKNEATPGFKVLGLSLTDLRSGISMVTATAQQMSQAVKAAWDFSKEGAQILQTRDSFDRLGLSMEEMRAASLGTIDDMALMKASLTLTAGASEELQGQLLRNAPQLMEIAKAANAVNPLLGDTAFMYDSIATGIKRSSPLILDNLGIVVKVGEANAIYAAQMGKAVEALTAEERSIALLNATIKAGQRLMEQAGGTAESYADAWARVEVEIKNNTDAMKANVAQGVQPLISRYADFLQITRENEQALIGFGGAMRFATAMLGGEEESVVRLGFVMDVLNGNYYDAIETLKRYRDGLAETSKTTEHSADSQKNLNKDLLEGISILEQARLQAGATRTMVSSISESQQELAISTLDSAEAWDMYSLAIDDSQRRNDAYTAGQVRDELAAIEEAALRAATQFETIKWATSQNLTENMEDFGAQLSGLRDKAGELQSKIGELEGMSYRTPEQDEELGALRTQLGEVRGGIDDVIAGMREMSARFVLGLIEMKVAADGQITEAEAAFMAGFAHQAGLIDDVALEQSVLISEIVDNMNTYGMTAEEALIKVIGQTDDLVVAFGGVGTAADTALGSVAASAGTTTKELMAIAAAVMEAQTAIDGMHGKDLDINVHFNTFGDPSASSAAGGFVDPGTGSGFGAPQASGGDYFLNKATSFIAGEAGRERAIFIPEGQPGYDMDLSELMAGAERASFIPKGQPGYDVSTTRGAVSATAGTMETDNSRTVNLYGPIFQGSQTATVRALSQMEF